MIIITTLITGCIIIIILIYYFEKMTVSYLLKTKNMNISSNIKNCFISNEIDDYIYINNNSSKLLILFPGINSDNINLHKIAKSFYFTFNNKYNIYIMKYNTCYTSIDDISTYLMYVLTNIIDFSNIKYNEINVIGLSYGCSIAIDTCIKLQSLNNIKLNNFICYKTFNNLNKVIKYQNNFFMKLFIKLFFSLSFGNYNYSNKQILNIKSNYICFVNHPYDEIIPIEAQFNNKFCKKYNIDLIYDTYNNDKKTYFNKLFGNHVFLNMEIINNLMIK
jgi:hypothetical protein